MWHNKKKAFIIMLVTILVVLVVGTMSVTYAWFLSKYTREYDFMLESTSEVVLMYDTDLTFASGDINTAGNILLPAKAQQLDAMAQEALSPLDVFDTSKVGTAAQAVKFTANGAYWTGEATTVGQFTPVVRAYLSSFATAQSLTAETLLSDISAGIKPLAANDLVTRGEIDYFMIFHYKGLQFLYYNGSFYVPGVETGSVFTLPAAAESAASLRYWHTPTAENCTVDEALLSDGTYLFLQPNTTFSYTLYAFVAKTDEELDPVINGERISLFATISVQ